MTSQGSPRSVFRRAVENGNLLVAEIVAREIGVIYLSEALELTALIALKERSRLPRLGARWLQRWLDESPTPTLEDAAFVAACLGALGGEQHEHALAALRGIATKTTGTRRSSSAPKEAQRLPRA